MGARVPRRKALKLGKRWKLVLLILWTAALALWTAVLLICLPARAAGFSEPPNSGQASLPKKEEEAGFQNFQPRFLTIGGTQVVDAPFIDQREGYPTGCESVTAVMALQYFGVEITVDAWIDNYLPQGSAPYYDSLGAYVGCDPRKAFPGDPRSEDGWGCYAPVIEKAARHFLDDEGISWLSVERPKGVSLEGLCSQYTDRGLPAAVWATIDMDSPEEAGTFLIEGTEESFTWIYPMHCLLLIGRDDSCYWFNDPLSGKAVAYEKSQAEQAYEGLGEQAVVFTPASLKACGLPDSIPDISGGK